MIKLDRRMLLPLGLLIGLQIFDVAIHIATNQVEPLRIASSVTIAIGGVAGAFIAGSAARWIILAVAALYLGLNLLFLQEFGLINPNTGTLRAPLFGFVALSLIFAYWLSRRRTPSSQ